MKSIKKLFFGAVGMALAATSVSGVAVAGSHGWEPQSQLILSSWRVKAVVLIKWLG